MNKISKIFISLLLIPLNIWAQLPLPFGHSHNDYLQKRPLFQAIELGFGSIEIDVCLDKYHNIRVAHDPIFLSTKKTIEEMYFDPIVKMINDGDTMFKYTNDNPLVLMIDIKKNADSTYIYLKKIFLKYADYIKQYKNNDLVHDAPLYISISGAKPWQLMQKDTLLFAHMDGSLELTNVDSFLLANRERSELMDRASLPYTQYKKYKRQFNSTEELLLNMQVINGIYGARGIRTRFWAVPNNEKVWNELLLAGVTWINVDRLNKFSEFYKKWLSNLPTR